MTGIRAFFSKPYTRAAEWRALLYMAVTLARQILALEQIDPRRALQRIEMLEVWCWMAEAELCRQIAAEDPAVHARKSFDQQLPPIAAILQMFLVFIQRVKAGLKARIGARAYGSLVPEQRRIAAELRAAPQYIDTS